MNYSKEYWEGYECGYNEEGECSYEKGSKEYVDWCEGAEDGGSDL